MGHRLFVLGGAGNMGSEVTRALLQFPDVEEVAIGETNCDAAHRLASQLGDSRVRVVPTDVARIEEAADKVRGYDVLMNATYFGLFDPALRVACRARVNYADLISEPTAQQAALAQQSGITSLSGLGCTPGLSNVLAQFAARKLETTHEIHIHWASFRTVAPSEGLLDTIIWELASECPARQYFLNGRFLVVPPFEGSKRVRFAPPIGEQTVYYMPHTETVSLVHNFPGVRYVSVRGTWRPELMKDFEVMNRYGLLDRAMLKLRKDDVTALEATRRRIWQTHGGLTDEQLWGFFLNVEVIGQIRGKGRRIVLNASHPTAWKERSTAKMTGIPAAVGVLLLARHRSSSAGVIYPEQYFDSAEFLRELAPFDEIKIEESAEDLA